MTPPPTTPKRIEKPTILYDHYYEWEHMNLEDRWDKMADKIDELVNVIRVIIDRLSTIEEERK